MTRIVAAYNVVSGIRLYGASHGTTLRDVLVKSSLHVEDGVDETRFEGTGEAGACIPASLPITCGGTAPVPNWAAIKSAFVGKVLWDEATNSSDADGAVSDHPGDVAFDWTAFENRYAAWGKDGSEFPAVADRGRWVAGDGAEAPGRVWDWSALKAADNPLIQSKLMMDAPQLVVGPDARFDASEFVVHTWPDYFDRAKCHRRGGSWDGTVCSSTFLRYAVEDLDDGIGNDNGLCDANEACLFAPNLGAYQGHGARVAADWFVAPNEVPGVTLTEYEANGRCRVPGGVCN